MVSSPADLAHHPQAAALRNPTPIEPEGWPSVWAPGPSRPGSHVTGLRRGGASRPKSPSFREKRGWGAGAKARQLDNAMQLSI